jgi:hypothetical protein
MKLIDGIKAIATGQVRHIDEPLYKINLTVDESYSKINFAREYAITVKLGANQFIAEDLIAQSGGEVITHAVNHMKRAVAELVYGELRRDLFDLQMEMRNELNYYDSNSLKKLVKIMEKISL